MRRCCLLYNFRSLHNFSYCFPSLLYVLKQCSKMSKYIKNHRRSRWSSIPYNLLTKIGSAIEDNTPKIQVNITLYHHVEREQSYHHEYDRSGL